MLLPLLSAVCLPLSLRVCSANIMTSSAASAASGAAKSAPTYGVIWLHGLGDVGRSWSFLKQMVAPSLPGQGKWLFPDASRAPVTINGGMLMTSWFDISDIPLVPGATEYPEDIARSVTKVHNLIDQLMAEGIPSEKIIVGGFSQGGAITLHSVLRSKHKLAGGVVLSGWVLMEKDVKALMQEANAKTPIFWGHGTADEIVRFAMQQHGLPILESLGVPVKHKAYYGMSHSSSEEELADVAHFMQSVLQS